MISLTGSSFPCLIYFIVKSSTSPKLNDGILVPTDTAIPAVPFTKTVGKVG